MRNPNGYGSVYKLKKKLRKQWVASKSFGMNHTIHETRHTAISLLKTAGVNDITIKQIVGHKSEGNITESVYTHIPFPAKLDAINLIHPTVKKYIGRQI